MKTTQPDPSNRTLPPGINIQHYLWMLFTPSQGNKFFHLVYGNTHHQSVRMNDVNVLYY